MKYLPIHVSAEVKPIGYRIVTQRGDDLAMEVLPLLRLLLELGANVLHIERRHLNEIRIDVREWSDE